MALKTLFNNIARLGLTKKVINSSMAGLSVNELNFNDIKEYPILFTTTNGNHRAGKNTTNYGISIYYIDRLMDNSANDLDIINDSMLFLKNFVNSIKDIEGVVNIEENYDLINFTSNPMADNVCGSYVNIQIDVLNNSLCDEILIDFVNQIKQVTYTENGDYAVYKDEDYNSLEKVEIKVDVDVDGYYNSGYTEGYNTGVAESYDKGFNDGVSTQKDKLESITITENGSYSREDGFNNINVAVPDVNGDYSEGLKDGTQIGYDNGYSIGEEVGYKNGYNVGKEEGVEEGYRNGYDDGLDKGLNDAGGVIAESARVLNISENGAYLSQYSDNIYPDTITGYFDDGTPFYSYAELSDIVFDTGYIVSEDMEIEIWWKGVIDTKNRCLIGSQVVNYNGIFKICTSSSSGTLQGEIAMTQVNYTNAQSDVWYHLKMSYVNGLWVDGVKIGDFTKNVTGTKYNLYINAFNPDGGDISNGTFGMIKVNGNIIIPKAEGFYDTTKNEYLTITKAGEYVFTEEEPIIGEGNLIKTVIVDVPPKLSNKDISFGYSRFNKIPNGLVDWNKINSADYMFYECKNLKDIGDFDARNLTSMNYTFYGCISLSGNLDIDLSNVKSLSFCFFNTKVNPSNLDFSNVEYLTNTFRGNKIVRGEHLENLDFSKVRTLNGTFQDCELDYFPSLNTSNVTNMNYLFGGTAKYLKKVYPINTSKVTDMGNMFYDFSSEYVLEELPEFDCTNVTNMNSMFSYYQDKMDNFTTCGGWKNLKCNWNDNYGLRGCANLSYESCMNILNGLYDFRSNGDNSTTRTLKVHANFINLVGQEGMDLAVAKGWEIFT